MSGRVAEAICRTFEEKGGCFTLEDFHEHQSVWETPIHRAYRGYDVYVPPPNSYGLLLLLQLALLERQNSATLTQNSGETVALQLKAQMQALENGRRVGCRFGVVRAEGARWLFARLSGR